MRRSLLYIVTLLTPIALRAQEASVLSTGRWWRLDATQEGIYRLTTAQLPDLRGTACDSIAIYGGRTGALNQQNSRTKLDDLRQVATQILDHNANDRFDDGDELLFYAEGADRWAWDNTLGRWTWNRHPYANHASWYLTTSCPAPLRIATATPLQADTTLTTHTVVATHHNDLSSPFQSGQLWMGERFSHSSRTRTFTLPLPSQGASHVKVRYALASVSSIAASFRVSTVGYNQPTSIGRTTVYTTVIDELQTAADSYTFTVTYEPQDNAATGYLDYIELTATAPIVFNGGQLTVRTEPDGRHQTAAWQCSGGSGQPQVWEVTRAGRERIMASGNNWSDSATEARKYILFDGTHYLAPEAIEPLANQNLHGAGATDLVIVTLPQYLGQAQRLATLHEVLDGLSSLVVTDQQVFNEFSYGQRDPMAIRSLLRWLKRTHPQAPPRYLVLFGKGSYDNRNLLDSPTPSLVTYETPYSFDDNGRSYASDDILGYLSDEGSGSSTETLEVSTGRLPARNIEEATLIVDKLETYMTRGDLLDSESSGDWRNSVVLLADDADPGQRGDTVFVHSSETVARNIKKAYPHLNTVRLYADAFPQTSGAIGSYYPDLNNALRQRINYGCLLLNYIGHGSAEYIGTERYIELSDIAAYTNINRLPLLVTSTCSYGHYDYPENLCGAEACLLASAGMVSVISAARPISHIERFNNDVVINALKPGNTIGDALRIAKNRTPSPPCIGITGDPALRLSHPSNRVCITHINRQAVEDSTDIQASVLSRVTVTGQIQDSLGRLLTDFDGQLYPIVYDREMRTSTLANDNPGTEVSFVQQQNILYRGTHRVVGGEFEYSFTVPIDVPYSYDYVKLSHYATSATDDATGSYHRLMFGGMSGDAEQVAPPVVQLFIGDTNFRNGNLTGENPTILGILYDTSGINVGAGLGHDITATLDGNPHSVIVLNNMYEPDLLDNRYGKVSYTLQGIVPGRHTLELKAWNIFGLSSTASVEFIVRGSDTLSFSDLQCFPNPASTYSDITLRTNSPDRISSAELQIYNTRGQLIHRETPAVSTGCYMVGPVRWNVSEVHSGIYLVRMLITDTDGVNRQATAKCIVQ